MDSIGRQPLAGRAFWYGAELTRTGDWLRRIGARETAELRRAVDAVTARGIPLYQITRADFPLDATRGLLDDVRAELEDGRGMVRITGLDVAGWAVDDLRRLFWGLSTHLGT